MSLSRKLVENLVNKEVINNSGLYSDLDSSKLTELANQIFLLQVTQNDQKTIKKNLQDKIEHFSAIMSDS